MTLKLPTSTGEFLDYVPRSTGALDARGPSPTSRVLYAAAHVVADPLADNTPGRPARPDWEATMAFRRHLWAHGLGVADAMDTAQRGMGLDWPTAAELIRRSGAEARELGGLLACGVGTDQVRDEATSLDEVIAGYVEQAAVVQDAGATVILMASRRLAAVARGPEDYHRVYSTLLEQLDSPAILHWLGPMFDPALTGYWGSTDLDVATEVFLDVIKAHSDKVDGVKMSLLDADREIGVRRRLPEGVRCYTGDDFHYPELIKGDEQGHSDALLGIFDAIAPAAAAALRRLDAGDVESYDAILAPTVPLSRHIFGTPTYYYKTGIVFLAWLAGHQQHFRMVGGLESARSVPHLARLYVLADEAGLLPDPELAERRMRRFLDLAGVPR
ncbi:hypothetical protein FHR81_005626 [Actinoalloteichus hoggarensis]|uniref:Uncharacterized protein n=1 Tax=Actinoalloteichus hoggarensis TaxID=1470176 RepID=A0A221W7M5_9PSEU|nr:dihydrodipicolinate synthase family protein [Actinoalloteichus hoggarensis]ASO21908.1 hypothetical protein AHOG_21460 [Actinoalloteichus hoggarensis]MBB5924541.1 hypothetical protein [Actinoalloteichus hoggarensis]